MGVNNSISIFSTILVLPSRESNSQTKPERQLQLYTET